MKQIGQLKINNFDYNVLLESGDTCLEMGRVIPSSQSIVLSDNQHPQQLATTLLHEILHILLDRYDKPEEDKEHEQLICHLDQVLVSVLLLDESNKKLFDKLLRGGFE